MEFEEVVHGYVDATQEVDAAVAHVKEATDEAKLATKVEHDALRTLLVDSGITRTSGQHKGQTYVIRTKETQSRRTPTVKDMVHELVTALVSPFDKEVILMGSDMPGHVAGFGPGIPISFDDASDHIVTRAVAGLKERFIRYNTTLSITKATSGETAGGRIPHAMRHQIQERLNRYLTFKQHATQIAIPLQQNVNAAKRRLESHEPEIHRLIDDHAPETWSLKVPSRETVSQRPTSLKETRKDIHQDIRWNSSREIDHDSQHHTQQPTKQLTKQAQGSDQAREDNVSIRKPPPPLVDVHAADTSYWRIPHMSSTVAKVDPPRQTSPQRFLRRKTRVKTPRLNFGDMHTVLSTVIEVISVEQDCADTSTTIDDLCSRILQARVRILVVAERELEAFRDQRSTHENVVIIDRGRRG
jgi:hypothetical protein